MITRTLGEIGKAQFLNFFWGNMGCQIRKDIEINVKKSPRDTRGAKKDNV
jgi:hypothetical protein